MMYPGTRAQSKLPSIARASVRAGLKEAPEAAPKINAGTITARPHAKVIWMEPAPFIPDLFSVTLATTPSPKSISIIVPKNSAIYGNI